MSIVHHLSFFFSKPRGLIKDVGKLLWALMYYIVFVLVHLYLRLSENVLPCEFHKLYTLQDAILLFMIVVRKTPYFICYAVT